MSQTQNVPPFSVYVHVPFCDVRCPYCHFTCFVNRDPDLPLRWARAVAAEFDAYVATEGIDRIASVYFGGGTPSALPPDARRFLAQWLAETLVPRLDEGAEVTLEMNPESTWPESLRPWIDAGVNRVSLGIQSMDAGVLTFLGRLNTPASNRRALELATRWVENVSADLIVAAPPESESSLDQSIDEIAAFGVSHVSAYLLEIHETTRFGRDFRAGRLVPKPDDDQAKLYLDMVERLTGHGLPPYELSNFACPGFESVHNGRYWTRDPYIGLGPSAHSFVPDRRWSAIADTRAWCDAIEGGRSSLAFEERLDRRQIRDEVVLLGLRRREGIPELWVEEHRAWIERAVDEGWLRRNRGRLQATPEGWLLLDEIAARLSG